MRRHREIVRGVLLAGLLLAGPGVVRAQTAGAAGAAEDPRLRAVPASGAILLDGRLSEAAWAEAPPFGAFLQLEPEEGAAVSEPTVVTAVYDDDALYIGARMHDSGAVSGRLDRRDAYVTSSDWFTVILDPYHDHRTAYRFRVNPSGVRGDDVLSSKNIYRTDESWDPVWQVATTVSDSGWVAELRIPFSQLRFATVDEQVWGIQIEREISRRQEVAVFAFTPLDEAGGISRYGHLVGLDGITASRPLELLPYVNTRLEDFRAVDDPAATFGDPYRGSPVFHLGVGADLKYRASSNFTVDATINPDFGQVELDPAVINLTAFETRLEERRPFFVEGADLFKFGEDGVVQLFYPRRIGHAPAPYRAPGAVYVDAPENTAILGAAKVTGRSAGGWSVGILDAATAPAYARHVESDGTTGRTLVAPLSNYFIGRVQRDLAEGRTAVGALATSVHRAREAGPVSRLRSAAYSGGLDFQHEMLEGMWVLRGYAAGSWITGGVAAIREAQRSSARYYQRPDADHLDVDEDATALAGHTASIELTKMSGSNWRGRGGARVTSPGFEVNDLGFQSDADRVSAMADLFYVENMPGPVLRDWSVGVGSTSLAWNYDGDFLGAGAFLSGRGRLLNYWSGNFEVAHFSSGVNDRLTRGGPLMRAVRATRAAVGVESDPRNAWILSASGFLDSDEAGGWARSVGLGLELKPTGSWRLSVAPELSQRRSTAQYLRTVTDPAAVETYGQRYVFADLRQTTLAVETRLSVTFRPDLTLAFYARPFLASGAFSALKEFARPRTFDFHTYGEDVGSISREAEGGYVIDPDGDGAAASFTVPDPDFNRRSLQGNAILRWEWRPGSTLFLVWQQTRAGDAAFGDFAARRDVEGLLDTRPDNVFLIKVNYWLNL